VVENKKVRYTEGYGEENRFGFVPKLNRLPFRRYPYASARSI
jgi:hypothetical protein